MSEPLQAAWVLYELRRFDRAAGAARDALGSDPEDPAAHALLGLSLAAQADELRGAGAVGKAARLRTDAVTAAREAVRLDPAAAIGWYALATVLGGSGGDGAAAEAAAAEAVRLDAADPVALALVAHARLQQSDAAGALAAAEQALALDPGNRAAAQVRAVALSLLGRGGSGDAASEVLADRPEDADAWVVHGLVALYGGRYGEAAAAFGEGAAARPG
jgi:tetratricopeptide (TPR) repeat protein